MPLEQLQLWITQYGYAAIFSLLALGIIGLPVPDETLLTLTGFLIFKGELHPIPAYLSALGGTIVGISISYGIGNVGGTRALHWLARRLHIDADRHRRIQTWFSERGGWTLLVGYFVPGVRHLVALVAGSSGLPYVRFALYAYAGAAFWSACFVGAGFYLGEGWNLFPELVRPAALAIFLLALLAAAVRFLYRRRSAR
jgi:membrane protein DedA with SNARE-associated domain